MNFKILLIIFMKIFLIRVGEKHMKPTIKPNFGGGDIELYGEDNQSTG